MRATYQTYSTVSAAPRALTQRVEGPSAERLAAFLALGFSGSFAGELARPSAPLTAAQLDAMLAKRRAERRLSKARVAREMTALRKAMEDGSFPEPGLFPEVASRGASPPLGHRKTIFVTGPDNSGKSLLSDLLAQGARLEGISAAVIRVGLADCGAGSDALDLLDTDVELAFQAALGRPQDLLIVDAPQAFQRVFSGKQLDRAWLSRACLAAGRRPCFMHLLTQERASGALALERMAQHPRARHSHCVNLKWGGAAMDLRLASAQRGGASLALPEIDPGALESAAQWSREAIGALC